MIPPKEHIGHDFAALMAAERYSEWWSSEMTFEPRATTLERRGTHLSLSYDTALTDREADVGLFRAPRTGKVFHVDEGETSYRQT